MATATFFNFGNQETFHFYKWIMESEQVNVNDLIAKAFTDAENDEWFKMGDDVCNAVRDALAAALEEMVARVANDVPTYQVMLTVEPQEVAPHIGDVWNSPESLWLPILALGLSSIDCKTVALAILIEKGKWAPSKELPEVE